VTVLRAELGARAGVLRAEGARSAGSATFDTIYLGGGTPTVLPADLLLGLVRDLAARLRQGGEFTIEANPGTMDAGLLERLASEGVTRLSVGIQSFSPAGRAGLGRRVTQAEVAAALAAIGAVGWCEWNLDLVFGIPGQTWRDTEADIATAVAAEPAHISLYDLTYSSSYGRWWRRSWGAGALGAAGAVAEQHYAEAAGRLEAAGYRRYEVSNFARPGHECRHNLAYWRERTTWAWGRPPCLPSAWSAAPLPSGWPTTLPGGRPIWRRCLRRRACGKRLCWAYVPARE